MLKLDVKGFFMAIDRNLLWTRLRKYLLKHYREDNAPKMLELVEKTVLHDPTENCVFASSRSSREGLPEEKSLFRAPKGKGLPIGNLTSQVFANFYMSDLDHYVKHDLRIRGYGRFVDDFFLVHNDREYLKECRRRIESFLLENLGLKLNHRKTYLQRVEKGVKFLGVVIEPGHVNMSRRTIGNFKRTVEEINRSNGDHRLNGKELKKAEARINSYLGILSHYDTHRVASDIIGVMDLRLHPRLKGSFCIRRSSKRKVTLSFSKVVSDFNDKAQAFSMEQKCSFVDES